VYRGAGHVPGVDNAAGAVAALAAELKLAVWLTVEVHPQLARQVKDVLWPLAHAHVHHIAVAQAIADAQRVFNMLLGRVARA
jgi:hypothetical protein